MGIFQGRYLPSDTEILGVHKCTRPVLAVMVTPLAGGGIVKSDDAFPDMCAEEVFRFRVSRAGQPHCGGSLEKI